ncbi:conserved hypothetical protein [Verrucomicrobia bacterium]|nr:conserved hypothetical protein [Verrucomicrobiota bacterium]
MKNANIFIDVDLTLVDANGKLLEGAKAALTTLKDAGCHLFLVPLVNGRHGLLPQGGRLAPPHRAIRGVHGQAGHRSR